MPTYLNQAGTLAALIERYARILRQGRGLDLELLSKGYDGLHLTIEGYIQTHSKRSGSKLLDWDGESTVWFRWVFSRMEEKQRISRILIRYDQLWHELSGWSTEDYTCRSMPANEASKKVYIRRDTIRGQRIQGFRIE